MTTSAEKKWDRGAKGLALGVLTMAFFAQPFIVRLEPQAALYIGASLAIAAVLLYAGVVLTTNKTIWGAAFVFLAIGIMIGVTELEDMNAQDAFNARRCALIERQMFAPHPTISAPADVFEAFDCKPAMPTEAKPKKVAKQNPPASRTTGTPQLPPPANH